MSVARAVLATDVFEIYTDVDGVFTSDPRMVPRAMSTHDALEATKMYATGRMRAVVECASGHDGERA